MKERHLVVFASSPAVPVINLYNAVVASGLISAPLLLTLSFWFWFWFWREKKPKQIKLGWAAHGLVDELGLVNCLPWAESRRAQFIHWALISNKRRKEVNGGTGKRLERGQRKKKKGQGAEEAVNGGARRQALDRSPNNYANRCIFFSSFLFFSLSCHLISSSRAVPRSSPG